MPRRFAESSASLLRTFFLAPVRPQTYLNLLYLSLAFPLGLAYFVFVSVSVPLSVGLIVVIVGIPLLAFTVLTSLFLANLERRLTEFLLPVEIASTRELDGDSSREYVLSLATDLKTWTPLLYLPSKYLAGLAAFTIATTVFTTGISMLFVPLYYSEPGLYVGVVTDRPVELHPALYVGWNNLLVGFETVFSIETWYITTIEDAVLAALLGGVLCLTGVNILNALAWLTGRFTKLMLDGSYDVVGTLR